MVVGCPLGPSGKLLGGTVPPEVVEVMVAVGEEVPGMFGTPVGSPEASGWGEERPEPRSLKRERSFLSRAWMSSMPGALA